MHHKYSIIYLYTNTVLGGCVTLRVCPFAIETTFPLSNFKIKHICGILMILWKFLKLWVPQAPRKRGAEGALNMGHRRRPKLLLFLFFYRRRRRHIMGADGALNAAPGAPFSRRAREIPPKAGISRVFINLRMGNHIRRDVQIQTSV